MAASAAYIPGVSLSDKLRLAASKGQVDKVRELLGAGATFEADRVNILINQIKNKIIKKFRYR